MVKITQSLIKAFQKVEQGFDCPFKFKALYIDFTHHSEPTPAMSLGHYFEYLATGQLPRGGNAPEPIMLQSGTNKGTPNKEYRNATLQAENFKSDIEALGFKITQTGIKLVHPIETDVEGTTDLLATHPKYGECIIDLKYSGLINDKWNELGWVELAYKIQHMTQALHYTFLRRISFFFAVYSSANEWERKWFRIIIDPDAIVRHYQDIQLVRKLVADRTQKPNGFPAKPSLSECIDCPVKCKFEAKHPKIEDVHYPQ